MLGMNFMPQPRRVGLSVEPSYDERRDEWSLYAFDSTERPKVGHRSREWTAGRANPSAGRARDDSMSTRDRRAPRAEVKTVSSMTRKMRA